MNMNEIYETLQGISLSDISAALSRLDESGHALTQTELIWLAAAAAAGLLLCLFGLKIVRFWAAVLGLGQDFLSVLPQGKQLGQVRPSVWAPGSLRGSCWQSWDPFYTGSASL